ncbi:hypothetical protein [Psychroflexus sediminis]|uniref:Uncharacterized protein n=1 Tax=Psychroflexus sediminis TaxID=470826 RepID=A0A1G7XEM7_9FLAO|nr:hypothetical protein [Psychroflexus sediminis]SDG82577.1 hypothetical protein SAMN04488027_10858 [Psychroflexus sediminis]
METHTYICAYCSKEYVPRRRKVQKYCSDTCRVKAHFQKNKLPKNKTGLAKLKTDETYKEKINLAGIGNAAIANVATETLKSLFTSDDNKPLTKGDFKTLMAQFKKRYEKIDNMPRRADGTLAYFDSKEKKIVYL